MGFIVVGLSHRTAPVEVRERVSVAPPDLPEALAALRATEGIRESVLVSTCNRTEVYAEVADPERDSARLRQVVADLGKLPLADIARHLYDHRDAAAVRHVFRVAASLDSMVVGESQILGQVKAAFAAAQAAENARGSIVRLMERAFAVAKRVRTDTALGESTASVASAAVDLARTIFGELEARAVLLVGAGEMGRLTLRHLRGAGVASVYVANRTERHACEALGEAAMASFFVPLDGVGAVLDKVDVVVSTVQLGRFLLERSEAEQLMGRRRGRPLFLVDLAVPRSLDPAAHRIENLFLYDIDDLQGIVERNLAGRRAQAELAEQIVDREVEGHLRSLRESDVGPTIRAALDRLETLRRSEIERHLGDGAGLSPEARAAVEAATRALVSKLVHGPIQELKRAAQRPDGDAVLEALRRALLPDEPGRRGRGRSGE